MSVDLSHLLSDEANSRKPTTLKEAHKYYGRPDIIYLGSGLPLADLFPFENVSVETLKPPFVNGVAASIIDAKDDEKITVTVPKFEKLNIHDDIVLSDSLQYGNSYGNRKLVEFCRAHCDMVHHIPYKDWDLTLSVGNSQGWDTVLRTLTNRGEYIFAEEYTFPAAVEAAHGLGLKVIPLQIDLDGIIPEKLEEQLANWPKDIKMPKLIYTIPTGQNPAGSTLSLERRQQIYKIAQTYDLIIIEDEPYYFLQMEPYTTNKSKRPKLEVPQDHNKFLGSLVKSFLSMDFDGRVIRLDSFSKILGPGCRTGWITGQARLIERILRQSEVGHQVPSGFAQSIIYGLLNRWGQDGYLDWLVGLRQAYTVKRDVAMDAINKYCPKDIIEFSAPQAGMFFWLKLDALKHPKFHSEFKGSVPDLEMHLYNGVIKQGTLLIPGNWFIVDDKSPEKEGKDEPQSTSAFFRGMFGSVPEDQLDKAIEIFGNYIKKEFDV